MNSSASMLWRQAAEIFILLSAVGVIRPSFGIFDRYPGESWRWSGRIKQYERKAVDEASVKSNSAPEVQNYDRVYGTPYWGVKVTVKVKVHWKRSATNDARDRNFASVLGSAEEVKLYDTAEKVKALHGLSVLRAELYERPLSPDASCVVIRVLRGRQYGVVVTLSDGRRFMLVKGNQMGRGKETVAVIFDHLTDEWVKKATKQVRSSTFGDFVKAGGMSYDLYKDNGNQAAERMMELE